MTTLNPPDPQVKTGELADLPQLPREQGGPVFAAPWQAQAFALAVKLPGQGHFTWKEWADAYPHTPHRQPVVLKPEG